MEVEETIKNEFKQRIVEAAKKKTRDDSKRRENALIRSKIESILTKYHETFYDIKDEITREDTIDEISEERIDQLVEKIEILIERNRRAGKEEKEITKEIKYYIDKLQEAISTKVKSTNDIKKLQELACKITPTIHSVNDIGIEGTSALIQSKIVKIRQQEAINKMKNNIPEKIKQIIVDIANGTLDIEKADEVINAQAKKRTKQSSKSTIKLTEERQRRQIIMQINTALRENGKKFPIDNNMRETIKQLVKLEQIDELQAIEIVIRNVISRKEYGKARAICNVLTNNSSGEHSKQLKVLYKQVAIAEITNNFYCMVKKSRSFKEQKNYYSMILELMIRENINPNQVPIGKLENGTVIYLNKVWNEEKQR